LRSVLVVVEAVFSHFSLAKVDAKLDEEEHDGLQGGDGLASGTLGGDMFVKNRQGSLLLSDSDEFLSSLYEKYR